MLYSTVLSQWWTFNIPKVVQLPWHFCQSSVESSVSMNPQVQGLALPHLPCPWTDSCIHRLLFTFTWTSKGISCHRLKLKPALLLSPSVWWMVTPFWWLETKPLGSFLTPLFLLHLRFYPLMNTVTFTSIILSTLSDHTSTAVSWSKPSLLLA